MQSSSLPKASLAIAEAFKTLKDPRRVKSCDHPLLTIVVIAIAAVICGVCLPC